MLLGDWSVIKTLLLYSVPAGTPVSPLHSPLFLFHPSFVTVCQRIEKQLRALKGLIHLPLFCLWSVCLFLFAIHSESTSYLTFPLHFLSHLCLFVNPSLVFSSPYDGTFLLFFLSPFSVDTHTTCKDLKKRDRWSSVLKMKCHLLWLWLILATFRKDFWVENRMEMSF